MAKRHSLMCYSRASRFVVSLVLLVTALGFASCDGSSSSDPSIHGVSGAISGLAPGESVRLVLDGKYPITVSSSGTFTFPVAVSTSAAYAVTVATLDFPGFSGHAKLTAKPARREADASQAKHWEGPTDLPVH
jgi:hypothetical protein